MLRRILSRSFLCGVLVSFVLSFSCAEDKQSIFVPANNLDLEDDIEIITEVDEEAFFDVIETTTKVYEPIVESFGAELLVRGNWLQSTVNASATRSEDGSLWIVDMFGGLARRKEITKDGFNLVLCHEIGHHLAGFPFVQEWASNEGQSDYFSTHACARLLWDEDFRINEKFVDIVEEIPKEKCDEVWIGTRERHLCYRIMVASKSTANLLASLQNNFVSFEREDTRKVRRTLRQHPIAQCRLDTFMAGALCTKDFNSLFIPGLYLPDADGEAESNQVLCNREEGYLVGSRPRCWYKPELLDRGLD